MCGCLKTVPNSDWKTTRRSGDPTGQTGPEKSVFRSRENGGQDEGIISVMLSWTRPDIEA